MNTAAGRADMTPGESGDWYSDMHTAGDIAWARQILMKWTEHTGSTEDCQRMAGRITARAVALGLEKP